MVASWWYVQNNGIVVMTMSKAFVTLRYHVFVVCRQAERTKLLQDSEDNVGDFAMVERETDILRNVS